jgi:hypothetical protein
VSTRFKIVNNMTSAGLPSEVGLIQNPTIDDVLVIEMKLFAVDVVAARALNPGRRVDRGVRDSLIKVS